MKLAKDEGTFYVKNGNISNKKIYISGKSVCWFLLALQLLMANITKHSVYYQISALMFMFSSFLYLFLHKGIRINKYYIIIFIFIIYNLIIITLGDVINKTHSINMVKTISINLILLILFYSFIAYVHDTEKLLKLYVKISAITDIIILFIFRDTLNTGRLAFSWADSVSSYKFFGIEVITAGSNGIAYFSAIAFLLSSYLFFIKGNKCIYLFYDLLFVCIILLTGSRKGIFILVIGFVCLINILSKHVKKVPYIIVAIMIAISIYFLSQNIPLLYEIMGSRLNELFNLILKKQVSDSSINTRMRLIEMAIAFAKEHPIFGYGLDAFRILGPWGIITDNNYLEIIVSSGIVGFIIYYSYIIFVLRDYFLLKNKSKICKLFFIIFILNLIIEYGSVTYFERNFGFINAMLFYILQAEKKEGQYGLEKK